LIFGSYPKIATAKNSSEKIEGLEAIKNGYLLKDILELDNIKDSLFVFNLLRLVAFQIGNDISYSELATNLNVNSRTVRRYLELLEKTFVLFSLLGFSRNLRKEYTKTPRYYFWDNGIRNAIISNYNSLNVRDDVGKLWENYCISERIKMTQYKNIKTNRYFWRTYDQKEIDYIEERDGEIFGYEFKWKEDKVKKPKEFLETYKNSSFKVVNQENYLDFILKK
jgi:predicted AAA+ superfamily ATPase